MEIGERMQGRSPLFVAKTYVGHLRSYFQSRLYALKIASKRVNIDRKPRFCFKLFLFLKRALAPFLSKSWA